MIALMGLRGSGKTTLGKAFVERHGGLWLDLDPLIVGEAGCSIAELIATRGEPAFREIESRLLRHAIGMGPNVLSLGGGAVLLDDNRILLRQHAAERVYLRCDVDELHRRLVADANTATQRPSLTKLSPRDEIVELLRRREPLYRDLATHELDVTTLTAAEAADALSRMLARP